MTVTAAALSPSTSAATLDQHVPTPPTTTTTTTEQSASPIRAQASFLNTSSPESPLQSSPTSIESHPSSGTDEFPVTQEGLSRGGTAPPISVSLPVDSSPGNFLSFLEPFQQSLSLADTLLPETELDTTGTMPFNSQELQHTADPTDLNFSRLLEDDNEDIEEIIRQSDLGPWGLAIPGQGSSLFDSFGIPRGPPLAPESQEMLIMRFDKLTCGILSVKDGQTENPWRTLIWPLAKDTPALYHAIFALAAFHSCKENPSLRVQGVGHMRQSMTYLMQQIQNMRADAALATSLALAFADTWDHHTNTCIQHLRGAKALVSQVLIAGLQSGMRGDELDRVRFLYNTWSYMDVIARLTSVDECDGQGLDISIFHLPDDVVHEIDPLMGCATTLFPLMSRVARLIQRVRKIPSNSLSIVSQAMELKTLVERWEPPRWFVPPQDPSSEVQHSIQVAHAYRWATLLYLHQAVPEMPSEPAEELAKRVLILLATVPPTSRTTIIQVYPLLAAGCEVDMEDDRRWVLGRWSTIQSRLMLGHVDRCLEVLQEVWARRDAFEVENEQQEFTETRRTKSFSNDDREKANSALSASDGSAFNGFYNSTNPRKRPVEAISGSSAFRSGTFRRGSALSSLENIEFERTVRGRLHWVSVMAEWGWEGQSQSISPHINIVTDFASIVFLG